MNRKSTDRFTITLGLSQAVILMGITTGCLALSFYLGFFSGKRVGFTEAMESNIALVPKIPITNEPVNFAQVDLAEKVVNDVYEDLKGRSKDKNSLPQEESEIPLIQPLSTVVADTKGKTSLDPWVNTAKNNQQIPETLADHISNLDVQQKSKVDSAIDKALDTHLPTLTPISKEQSITVTPTFTATTKVTPTNLPTKTPTAVITKNSDGASILRGSVSKGWYAQVAAPTSKSEADSLAQKLKENGFRVAIESAQVRGESYYRILVGPEENRQQAEALVNQLTKEKYISTTPFIRMVK